MTNGDPLAGLARELGSPPPAGLAALPPETLEDLAAAVARARDCQAAVLEGRGELAAMGVFVGYLSEEALSATLGRLSTDALLGHLRGATGRLE